MFGFEDMCLWQCFREECVLCILPSCEPIITRSAYEAAIYFKLLCQYFCLKASLIPCVDSVEAFYHCFLFEFDLAAFSPWFQCFAERLPWKPSDWDGEGMAKFLCEFQSPECMKAAERWLQLSSVSLVTLKLLKIAGIMEAWDSNDSGWLCQQSPMPLWRFLQVQCLCLVGMENSRVLCFCFQRHEWNYTIMGCCPSNLIMIWCQS